MYVFLNQLLCVLTLLLIILMAVRYRYLLLKPSIVFLTCFHIQIQWAATFQAGYIEQYLPHPYAFLMLAQVFPLLGLIVGFFLFHNRTLRVYRKIADAGIAGLEVNPRSLILLFGAVLVILLVYLAVVPLAKTGIYAILLDPLGATEARESSLKLLDSALLQYSFSLLKSALAPLLCVLASLYFIRHIKQWQPTRSALALALILFTLITVSLPGARTPAAMLILTIFIALFIAYNMPIKLRYMLPALLLIIALPVFFTLVREGQNLNIANFFQYLQGGIFNRIFVVPMETGLWHVHYAQDVGFVGVAGIPKLAEMLAVEPVNLGNIIYMSYSPYQVASGLSNTSFVFAYYSCFGIVSLLFSWLATWALDLAVLWMDKLKSYALLLATAASLITASFAFISTMYTTALITNGFILILAIAWMLDRFVSSCLAINNRKKIK